MFKQRCLKKEIQLWGRNIFESIMYRFVRERTLCSNPQKIVFVCTGNICRSAFAEQLLKTEAFPIIESCGLDVKVRSPSPDEAVRVAEKNGLNLRNHLSKGIECCDIKSADLILAMEYWQYRKLVELLPQKRRQVRLLREFAPFPENLLCNINDPFGLTQQHYERCFEQIRRSVFAIRTLMQ